MADWIKIGVKAGLVATATATLIVLLSFVSFPALDLSIFTQGIAFAYALGDYYFPAFNILISLFIPLLGLRLLVMTISLVLITIRWVLKVNE